MAEIDLTDQSLFKKAVEIKLTNAMESTLNNLRVNNIIILEFNEELGPQLKFYTKKDDLVNKMLQNPAYVAEMTIIAKHCKEATFRNGSKTAFGEFLVKTNRNFVLVEISKESFSWKPKKLAEHIAKILGKEKIINEKTIINAISAALSLLR
ncbi:MAG: hypothetical protein ACP6IQ_07565 [Candidatus Njordarchaeia archaeon]|nr:hypothetical protein [Candidatus Korarchaeota archaeon]